MTTSLWWAILVAMMAVAPGLLLKLKAIGALVAVLLLYIYLQASSHFFWIPWYKDGGNGAGLADWYLWLPWAFSMTALASIPLLVGRLVGKMR